MATRTEFAHEEDFEHDRNEWLENNKEKVETDEENTKAEPRQTLDIAEPKGAHDQVDLHEII